MPKHVYPDAEWLPVEWANARDDDTNPTCAVLHVAASEAVSLRGYFTSSRIACSTRTPSPSPQSLRATQKDAETPPPNSTPSSPEHTLDSESPRTANAPT